MNWTKKWCNFKGQFEHISDDGLVAIFKDADGYKYRFIPSVMTNDYAGYATSTHFWKTLSSAKSHLEKNTHLMVVVDRDNNEDYGEYEIAADGKIVNTAQSKVDPGWGG